MSTEPRYLDLSQWPRRESFEYFRHYDKPYFNICTRVDVAPLRQALEAAGRPCSVMLACHHLVLRLACQIEPLRYRIEQARVRIHEALDASITVLRDDQSLGFALLRYREALRDFTRSQLGPRRLHPQVRLWPFRARRRAAVDADVGGGAPRADGRAAPGAVCAGL